MKKQQIKDKRDHEAREAILGAARRIVEQKGIEALSMRNVASEIGYSATHIYSYFKNKEDMIQVIYDGYFLAMSSIFEGSQSSNPINQLRRALLEYLRFFQKNENMFRLLFLNPWTVSYVQNGDSLPNTTDLESPYSQFIELVERCKRFSGARKNTLLIAQSIWSSVHGVLALRASLGEDKWFEWKPIEEVYEEVVKSSLNHFFSRKDVRKHPLKGSLNRPDLDPGSNPR